MKGSTDEPETSLERLRRLRSEIAELEEDVKRDASDPTSPQTSTDDKGKGREVTPAVILRQLQLLQGDLKGVANILGVQDSAEVLEGEGEAKESEEKGLASQAKSTSGLLSRLGLVAPSENSPTSSTPTTQPVASTSVLETRLATLEKALGASEADVSEVNPLAPPLLPRLSKLDHLLTLLSQPRHLDSISRRVKVLVSDLERLHEGRRKLGDTRALNVALQGGMTVYVPGSGEGSKSGTTTGAATPLGSLPVPSKGAQGGGEGIPPEQAQKIDAVFALLPRLDPLLPLTPRLLARLRSLSTLHSSAAAFSETLESLKVETARLGDQERGLKETLDGLEGSVKGNEEKVRANMEGLEKRVSELILRMDKQGV